VLKYLLAPPLLYDSISLNSRIHERFYHETHGEPSINMPLVVPGLMTKDGGSSGDDWMSKLMGKKIGEQHDEVVSTDCLPQSSGRVEEIGCDKQGRVLIDFLYRPSRRPTSLRSTASSSPTA
jgi:hypothetical protein